ncbi:ATP-binding protein [Streptomyces sp. WMMC500]|uniref:ATP-binding protein n=1 Tax=Streptomyces sp. WMMC500 TaxID=3015154 RepID=UPI00248C1E88|nr:ATP-binding protein [Streptomyces sp. WMMC500]WBB63754.1 ATP-binding protein [Streptomyces sp. WMMC500]
MPPPLRSIHPTHLARPAHPAPPRPLGLPADARSVPRARRAVLDALPDPHRPRLGGDLQLLASELVTNAVRHGTRPAEDHLVELLLWPADGHYWLAVSDPGPGAPVLSPTDASDASACGGRGLLLVDALSAVWGVVPRRVRGKAVVAGLRLDTGDHAPDDHAPQ